MKKLIKTSPETQELRKLIRRTEKANPDPQDVESFRSLLQTKPNLWRIFGDLSEMASKKIIQNASCGNRVRLESLTVARTSMQREFGYQKASALERFLIDQVIQCWFRLNKAELDYSKTFEETVPLPMADYWERKLTQNQKRYLKAVETLAKIRRLKLPVMQVNIGEKQINIAG